MTFRVASDTRVGVILTVKGTLPKDWLATVDSVRVLLHFRSLLQHLASGEHARCSSGK